ncbi:hypothetical protein E8E14_002648 [Neopestalotiopsis sp. 37M]|nr:hypothetical protein E8E14_002648 [Neopestalotiopsis sp. 37M]
MSIDEPETLLSYTRYSGIWHPLDLQLRWVGGLCSQQVDKVDRRDIDVENSNNFYCQILGTVWVSHGSNGDAYPDTVDGAGGFIAADNNYEEQNNIYNTVGTASTTNIGATSTSTFTTEPGTPSTTFVTTTSSSSVTLSSTTGLETTSAVITTDTSNTPSTTSSASLTSTFSDPSPSVVEGSTSATSSATQGGTATALPPPASADLQSHSLAPGQVAAVVVGAIAFTIFVSVVAYLVRFAVMRRRQSSAEKRQRLDGQDATTMEQRYYPGGAAAAAAAAAASRSRSLHEGEFRIVIRTPPPAAAPGEEEEEQRMRQLWPSPPGGTQRFTFFSGRSTTTATDSATDRGQWSQGTENGSSGPSHGYRNP